MSAAAQRSRRFGLAVATSVIAKVVGAVAQLLALPMILSALGTADYGAFLALGALIGWVGPLGLGVLPALTRLVAEADAMADRDAQARLLGAALTFTLGGAAVIIVASLVVVGFDLRMLLGAEPGVSESALALGFGVVSGLVALQFVTSLSPALRGGYQEMHRTNVVGILANTAVLTLIALSVGQVGALPWYAFAFYAPFALAYGIDLALLLRGRPGLWPVRWPNRSDWRFGIARQLLRTSGTTWAGQLHFFLTAFGTTLLAAHLTSAEETSAFGSSMRALQLLAGGVAIFVWPLVPALTDARARGDAAWARAALDRILLFGIGGAAVGGAFLAAAGPALVPLWLHGVRIDALTCLGLGGYFLTWNATFIGFNLLLALDDTRGVGAALLLEAALVYAVAYALTPELGVAGVALALPIAGLAVSAVWMPWRARRRVLRMAAAC